MNIEKKIETASTIVAVTGLLFLGLYYVKKGYLPKLEKTNQELAKPMNHILGKYFSPKVDSFNKVQQTSKDTTQYRSIQLNLFND